MPLVPGSAFWGLHRVFSNSRTVKEPQNTESKPGSISCLSSSRKFSHASNIFSRRTSSPPPGPSPRRSTSAPQEVSLKSSPDIPPAAQPLPERLSCSPQKSGNKPLSSSHTFPVYSTSAPNSSSVNLQNPDKKSLSSINENSSHIFIHCPHSASESNYSSLEFPASNAPKPKCYPCALPLESPSSSQIPTVVSEIPSLYKSSQSSPKTPVHVMTVSCKCHNTSSPSDLSSPPTVSKTASRRATSSTSSHTSSHNASPLNSPSSPHSSPRRASPQGQQLPMTPSPPWIELVEARRRLLAVEGRRKALCALEMRVQQIHCVFLQAELRVSRQREGLARLVEAAGRAEVQATVQGQRLRRALRHHKPRLLACTLCVPLASKTERRGGQHPRRTRCSVLQSRVQSLGGCVGGGSEDFAARD